MRSRRRLLPLLFGLVIVIEFYALVGLWVGISNFPSNLKWLYFLLYALITISFWLSLVGIPFIRKWHWSAKVQNFLLLFFTGAFICKIIVAAFMLLDDIRRGLTMLIFWLFEDMGNTTTIHHSIWLAKIAFALGISLWIAIFWGTKNKYHYQIRRVKLKFGNLPKSFRGLRIVQISDIHSGSFQDKDSVAKGIDLILNQKADLILFTGDLVNNLAEEIVPYKSIFGRLKAPLGVYSILGNHDYGDYVAWPSEDLKNQNLEALKQHHADMGWQLLMNEHRIFQRGKDSIALIGIENWGAKARFPKHGRLEDACKGIEEQKPALKILMSHDPSHWDAEVRKDFQDIDLTLSGHTHGMQFGFRLGGKWQWSPVQFLYRQWAGLYQKEKQYLYVNVGFGFLGYPGRLGMRPEITVIELI